MTIGQTGPVFDCGSELTDYVQPTVTSGSSYVVPSTVPNWMITSWSTDGNVAGTMTMKVFRPLGGLDYKVVGHDGPHPIVGGVLNTFPANVEAKAGDVLGLAVPQPGACISFAAPGESFLEHFPSLADGESGTFQTRINSRLDISAVVAPANAFRLAGLKRNERKGIAALRLDLPNPGELTVTGGGVVSPGATASAPGPVDLPIKASGKKRRALGRKGRVAVRPTITYIPAGGDPGMQSLTVKLRRNR